MENILGKKIELLPCKLKENQIHCEVCGGIGWLSDNGHLKSCPHCSNGAIDCCPECGTPYEVRYVHRCKNPECNKNYGKKQAEEKIKREAKRIANAEKIDIPDPFEKFTMLYSEYYDKNEGYFTDWDEFFDSWTEYIDEYDADHDLPLFERPEYVWGTSCTKISLDADWIIEQATDDLWEGASDNCDYKSLQEAIDKWCAEQSGTETYLENYKYAVRIPWELY